MSETKELIEFMIQALVDKPDEVKVTAVTGEKTTVFNSPRNHCR